MRGGYGVDLVAVVSFYWKLTGAQGMGWNGALRYPRVIYDFIMGYGIEGQEHSFRNLCWGGGAA